MYAVDPKLLARIEPFTRRVLVIDPTPAAARLMVDLLRGLGAREVMAEGDERRALEVAKEWDPGMVFVERSGPRLDGESFTKRLRRSSFLCRQAPVIMVTGEATATTIKGARDAGVHEFLRKPFTASDLLKRIEVVASKPRDWIEAVGYVGPDRRRFNSAEYAGPRKRKADTAGADPNAQTVDQCARILRAALAQFDTDPPQARRAMRQQARTLKDLSVATGRAALAVAAAGLEAALADDTAGKAALVAPTEGLLGLLPPPARAA